MAIASSAEWPSACADSNRDPRTYQPHHAISVVTPDPAVSLVDVPSVVRQGTPLALRFTVENLAAVDRAFVEYGATATALDDTADASAAGDDHLASIAVPMGIERLHAVVRAEGGGQHAESTPIAVDVVPGVPTAVGSRIAAVSLGRGEEAMYSFAVQRGLRYEVMMIPAASGGDVDLYVGEDRALSRSTYDCRPYESGTDPEVCVFTAAVDGYTHAMVHGFRDGAFELAITQRRRRKCAVHRRRRTTRRQAELT